MNLRGKPPCFSCDHHTETCHGTCEEYIKWAAERRAARDAQWQQGQQGQGGRDAENVLIESRIKQRKRRERG